MGVEEWREVPSWMLRRPPDCKQVCVGKFCVIKLARSCDTILWKVLKVSREFYIYTMECEDGSNSSLISKEWYAESNDLRLSNPQSWSALNCLRGLIKIQISAAHFRYTELEFPSGETKNLCLQQASLGDFNTQPDWTVCKSNTDYLHNRIEF